MEVHLSLDQAVRVQALARNIVLCSWEGHLTLTVPLSSQVYKWVPVNSMPRVTNPMMDWLASYLRGTEILLVTSCTTETRTSSGMHLMCH